MLGKLSFWLILKPKYFLGKLLNLTGAPGFVRECDHGGIGSVYVKVRISPLFTVISVNGYDVFFKRITGKIDGTGSGSPEVIEKYTGGGSDHAAH